jgi:hypothetical protein
MIGLVPGAEHDPERARLALSIWTWKTVTEVAAAVSAATNHARLIYVEWWTNVYRWSPAHRGGSYPPLRAPLLGRSPLDSGESGSVQSSGTIVGSRKYIDACDHSA